MRAFLRPLAMGAMLASISCASPRVESVSPAEMRAHLRGAVARREAPAVAAAAVRGERIAFLGAEGEADLSTRAPATPDTAWLWFSVTKLVTATAVMQLAEQGRVDLDRPVRAYVPSFAVENRWGREPTVRHLLSHSAGLSNPVPITWIHLAADEGPPLDDMVAGLLAKHGRLEFEPGSRYAYSNIGYLVLGQVIERAGGERYADYVKRHILDVLGMDGSGFAWPSGPVATGYARTWSLMGIAGRLMLDGKFIGEGKGGFTALRPFLLDGAPYGGLVGTVPDLARFLAAHLNGGAFQGRRILGEVSAAAMRTRQLDLQGRPMPIGLGWHPGSNGGEEYWYHLGGGGGFKSELRLYPERGYGVVVVASETSFDTGVTARLVVE
jgi:CubicO group peptidase (beta-lactamase class C family)